jgi:hypothetical protein
MTGVVALVAVMILSDVAEARRFGRRRSSGNNCSQCNAPMQQGGQYNPNMGPGPQYAPGPGGPTNAPPPPPNAQTFNAPGGQPGNTTFYRGQPQLAPNANVQGNTGANANLGTNANANLGTNANANIQAPAPAAQSGARVQGGANVQGNTNLNTNNR